MFVDFIFGLLKVEQPENLERIQDNAKKRIIKRKANFCLFYGVEENLCGAEL